jgi:hypothetical protein
VRKAIALAVAALALAASSVARAADAPDWGRTLDAHAPTIVSLRYDLAVRLAARGQTRSLSRKRESNGVLVDPSGMVLASVTALEGEDLRYTRMFLKAMYGEVSLAVEPVHLKVQVGTEETERDAILVAKDTALDVAFLQVVEQVDGLPQAAKGLSLPSVDVSKPVEIRAGVPLHGVSRRGRAFDHSPYLRFAYASQRIEKPRAMWGVRGEFTSELGLPVFDEAGSAVGVLLQQDAGEGGEDEVAETATFLVPLDAIAKPMEAAKKRVAEAIEKARQAATEKPPEPAEPGMDGTPPAMEGEPPSMGGEPPPSDPGMK